MTDSTALPQDETATDTEVIDRHRPIRNLVLTIAAFLVLAGIGPMFFGAGPFGHRLLFGKDVQIQVFNLSDRDTLVKVSFGPEILVRAGTREAVKSVSGPIEIETRTTDGALIETQQLEAEGDFMYSVEGRGCFAVFDITSFYNPDAPPMTLVDRKFAGEPFKRIYADTFVPPRRPVPDNARGVVHWFEIANCDMLEPGNEAELTNYYQFRLQERRERLEAERAAAAAGIPVEAPVGQ